MVYHANLGVLTQVWEGTCTFSIGKIFRCFHDVFHVVLKIILKKRTHTQNWENTGFLGLGAPPLTGVKTDQIHTYIKLLPIYIRIKSINVYYEWLSKSDKYKIYSFYVTNSKIYRHLTRSLISFNIP